jgi:hypothetical protein
MREPIGEFLRQQPDDLSDWAATTTALTQLESRITKVKDSIA